MTDYSIFNFELQFIKEPTVRKLTEDILKYRVPDYIMNLPASSSLKYHPLDKNGNPETVVNHCKAVTRMLLILINHPMISRRFTDHEKDVLIACAILHDCVKYGIPPDVKEYTVHTHPVLFSLLYPYNIKDCQEYIIFSQMADTISAHHGPWRSSEKDNYLLPEVNNDMKYYLHMADFLASRRMIMMDLDDTDSNKRMLQS